MSLGTYQPSGRFGSMCIPLALGGGLLAAVAGGFAYQRLIGWIPFIYINFLLTFGLGIALALAVGVGLNIGKCRSRALAIAIGAAVVLMADYVSFRVAHSDWKAELQKELEARRAAGELEIDGDLEPAEVADQLTLGDFVTFRVETGWSLGRRGGLSVRGAFVWVFWLLELGILLACVLSAASDLVANPFCEACDAWLEEEPAAIVKDLSASDIERVRGARTLDPWLRLRPTDGDRDLTFTLHRCGGCERTRFLSADMEWIEISKKGDPEEEDEQVMPVSAVTPSELAQLRATYPLPETAEGGGAPAA